nr:MAG TPA: Large polyvalent protein associated domain 29 [Caudoviricetes sp.]
MCKMLYICTRKLKQSITIKNKRDMTTKEMAQVLREELKKAGYNNRKLSIKSGYCGYSSHIDITIKFEIEGNPRENEEVIKIKNIAQKFKQIDRCDVTGEILEGGNTYVNLYYNNYYLN